MNEHDPENYPWIEYDVSQQQESDDDPLVFLVDSDYDPLINEEAEQCMSNSKLLLLRSTLQNSFYI